MSERAASALYDALHAFESRYRGVGYPVHKRLRLDDRGSDIYDWAAARLQLGAAAQVLDAGCGVGFGTLRLARHGEFRVVGVTLSPAELESAREAAQCSNVGHRVQFRLRSFDDTPAGEFDAVVAVESLKHSADLTRSLTCLGRSLKPGGALLIVEDLFRGSHSAAARALERQWALTRLYREEDYVTPLGAAACSVIDLTDRVPHGSKVPAAARLALLGLARRFCGSADAAALRAFAGGVNLTRLYARGEMAYKAILYRRPPGERL